MHKALSQLADRDAPRLNSLLAPALLFNLHGDIVQRVNSRLITDSTVVHQRGQQFNAFTVLRLWHEKITNSLKRIVIELVNLHQVTL